MTEPKEKAGIDINTPHPPPNPVPGQLWRNGGYDWIYTVVGWFKVPVNTAAYPEILDIRIDHETKEIIFDVP